MIHLRRVSLSPALLSTLATAVACAGCAAEPPPTPVCPVAAPVATAAAATPAPAEPYFRVRLQPRADAAKLVHVDMELFSTAPLGPFRLLTGTPDLLTHASLSDASGSIPVTVAADGAGLTLTAARPPSGVTHLSYDVTANTESPFKPLSERVQDDRFIGSGEGLLLLPDGLADQSVPMEVVLDGGPLKVPNGASTMGVGAKHRVTGKPRGLAHVTFLAGALGVAEFDAVEGHDEAAWLGYVGVDPRPVAAEIAVMRTALAEVFKSQDTAPQTVLFVTQPRPLGSYTTTARAGGLLLQLGPAEPWSASLKVSVAQQLVRPWLGGELWVGPSDAAHRGEAYWFSEGVARFFVTRVLAGSGFLHPDDVRDEYAGETSVIALSPYRGKSNAELAALARTDDVARAHLVARGALYAARVNALTRDKSKGGWSIDTIVQELMEQARREKKPLPASAWVDAVARTLGDKERDAFAKTIEKGDEVVLPPNVLGRCYRGGVGEYVAFDLGFDAIATREGKTGEVVGLVPGGPAAKAGLRAGDIVEADYRDGHSEVEVKLTVKRGGAGSTPVKLAYFPAGKKYKAPMWTRLPGTPDEKCGDAW